MIDLESIVEGAVRRAVREEVRAVVAELRPAADAQELLTLKEAAKRYSVSVSTLKGWLRDGALRRYGRGSMVRVRPAEVMAAMLEPKKPEEISDEEFFARSGRR